MSWKTAYRSFYYQDAPEPEDIVLAPAETALLVIDIQNTYVAPKPDPADHRRWQPFFARMRATVIPNTARLIRHDEFIIESKGKSLAALVPVERLEQMRRLRAVTPLEIRGRQAGGPLSDDGSTDLALEAERWARGHTGTRRSATP